jgi:hypothetical protein
VFENKVLRKIFGPKRDDVTGGWRKLHNEELHDLYSSPSIIRIIKLAKSTNHKRSIIILRLGLPSGLFPTGFPTNNLYAFLFSPIRATCSAHLILFDLT